ncbi:MAG TPA: hypothetical protein VMV31_11525 [Terriglobales bacterium]|nr:hypothetical protein [Terriglobales bacterium]
MNWEGFEPLATTVLYEGHVLYPYRASALKNQWRGTLGTLAPAGASAGAWPARLHLEALIECAGEPEGAMRLCFLQGEQERVAEAGGLRGEFAFRFGRLQCGLRAELAAAAAGLWKLTVEASNTSEAGGPSMDSAQLRCGLEKGVFVSAQDPGGARAAAAAGCHCQGVYPVLVGEPGGRELLLAAPIILEDYARVAGQSRGDFCDASEMDELLMLRVLTLSEAEKAEIRAGGGKALEILEQCDAKGLAGLHGGVSWNPYAPPPEAVEGAGRELRVGDRVRLHPRGGGGDVFDQVLEGKAASIQAIEQDLEGGVQLAVVVEEDPGRDLGEQRQSGHRFFFRVAEVEPL